jgi:hypothetical protein
MKIISMEYPIEYRWLKAHKFNILTPWFWIEPNDSEVLRKEYQLESGMDIVPFARRQDNDDIAGFRSVNGEIQKNVVTVHLTWSSGLEIKGYPVSRDSSDLLEWIKEIMLPDSKEWMTEDELEDLIENNK